MLYKSELKDDTENKLSDIMMRWIVAYVVMIEHIGWLKECFLERYDDAW